MYNILDFGAVADGKTLSTKAVQEAVDTCNKNGGGTVLIPAGGAFVLGTIRLLENVHILMENGSCILGSKNIDDFEYIEELLCAEYQDRSHCYFHQSLFYAENCNNISITGNGTIDMQSVWQVDEGWRQRRGLVAPEGSNPNYSYEEVLKKRVVWNRGAKVIAFKECNNVLISDLIIRNATDLAVYVAGCENVRITKLDLKTHIDGISPDCCKNVVISDCILNCGDDALVPKSSYVLNEAKPCENLTITNCIVSSRCNAIKFGTESVSGFLNIAVSNCVIHNTRSSGVAIEAVDGAVISGVSISNISMKNVGNPFMMIVLHRGRAPKETPIGKIKNISISNITATGPYEEWESMPHAYDLYLKNEVKAMGYMIPPIIAGQKDSIIENVFLSNIQITMPGGGTKEDREIVIPEVRQGYPESFCFGWKLPVYGMFARDVNNLKLFNVEFFTEKDDERDAIFLDRVTNYKNI